MKRSKKRYRVKKKKSIFRNKLFQAVFLIVLILSFFSWLVIFAPLFQIKMILVSGNKRISISEIEQLTYPETKTKLLFFESQSIFLTNPKLIKAKILENYPLIDDLKIKKLFPNSLSIEIMERQRLARWSGSENYFFIDKNGIAFEQSDNQAKADLIITSMQPRGEISVTNKVIEEETLSQILNIKETIEAKTEIKTEEFILFESEARLNVKTTESWQIYFYLEGDVNWQLIELELILEKQLPAEKRQSLEYIDLRFSKTYYQ
ncbi:FtsQ-type POTRA domain-containing protein [Candidatus Parcubacteria bacterium]|nr:FtsQ-type POTRA domain-containing protein [Patescibacteria group bacterium]MBU4466510.1 FtsQ-type POTRA domain-containing protein [Patescibacteria group bacterium]MCG2688794.1 FtsQ-type POTRA domain-containing protein [Candidatus Parcubacteria bacterium]